MIKVLMPADSVRAHPERYWGGHSRPSYKDVNLSLVHQLEIDGCKEIEVCRFGDFQIVCCESEWVRRMEASFGSVRSLFEDVVGQPKTGPNDLRVEWFLAMLAKDVFVVMEGDLIYLKMESRTLVELDSLRTSNGRVCIGYRM